MPKSTVPTAPAAAPSRAPASGRRRVIDAPTRMFHWLFALSFLGAYLSGDSERWRLLHVTLGYTMAGLLAFRLVYALAGPRQASLGPLWRKLAGLPAWLRSLAALRAPGAVNWRQGQHLAMVLAVALLLALVVPLTLTGVATFHEWGDWLGGDAFEELHEAVAELLLGVVIAHLALLVVLSLLQRRNQALPMLTGHAAGVGPDLVTKNRRGLAAALLLAVLAYGAWEWQASPNGLIPSRAAATPGADGVHDVDEDD